MFGFPKPLTKDVHPRTAWIAELDKIICAGKARHLNLRVMADDLRERGDALARTAAITWQPTRIYSGNLPE
jgi:hypothetical protein